MEPSLTTIIGFLLCGLVLVLAELVIPGGIVGAVGGLLMVAAIVMGFMKDTALGMGLLIGSLVVTMVAFWLWVRLFPRTKLGKEIFLGKDGREWRGYDQKNAQLLGNRGTAHTILRPAGTVLIDDERVDAVTEGEPIERGTPIEVIKVEGNRIVVAKLPAAAPAK
jgi:membrane-bound serine protease (ClpP class)